LDCFTVLSFYHLPIRDFLQAVNVIVSATNLNVSLLPREYDVAYYVRISGSL